MNNKISFEEFAQTVISLPADRQNSLFENLKKSIGPEATLELQKGVSLYSMFTDPEKYRAMKEAVCEKVCAEFYK